MVHAGTDTCETKRLYLTFGWRNRKNFSFDEGYQIPDLN